MIIRELSKITGKLNARLSADSRAVNSITTGSVPLTVSAFSARAYVEFIALIHGKGKQDLVAIFSLDTAHVSLYIHSIVSFHIHSLLFIVPLSRLRG